jgi:uncharacterized protein (UPF0147 family)
MPTKTITLDHLRKAAQWAKQALKKPYVPTKIQNGKRMFDMSKYDCGTACCIAGAAAIEAGFTFRKLRNPAAYYYITAAEEAGSLLHDKIKIMSNRIKKEAAYEKLNNSDLSNRKKDIAAQLSRICKIMNDSIDENQVPDEILKSVSVIEEICKEANLPLPEFQVTTVEHDNPQARSNNFDT